MTEAEFKRQIKTLEHAMQAKASVEAAAEIVKRGRPTTTGRGGPGRKRLNLSLSPTEALWILRAASEAGLKPNAWARRLLREAAGVPSKVI